MHPFKDAGYKPVTFVKLNSSQVFFKESYLQVIYKLFYFLEFRDICFQRIILVVHAVRMFFSERFNISYRGSV